MPCADCKQDLPPTWVMAQNAAGAVQRVVVAAVSGEAVKASSEQVAARKAACLPCEHLMTDGDDVHFRCRKCGCWLAGKSFSKWSFATERCPIGRWEAPA